MIPLVAKNPEFKALHNYYINRKNNPLKRKPSLKQIEYNPQKLINYISFLQLKEAI